MAKKRTPEEFIKIMKEKHPTIKVLGTYAGVDENVECFCEICGTIWSPKPSNLLYGNHGKGNGCKTCRAYSETSFPEQAIYYYVKQTFSDAINNYTDFSSTGMELDIYIPSITTGIEYDGIAWHKNQTKRDQKKYNQCVEEGIRLIRICEDPDRDNANADFVIIRNDLRSDASLTTAIKTLFEYLDSACDVDVDRDSTMINEQYHKYFVEHSLAEKYPEVAEYWGDKNGAVLPSMVSAGSERNYWFKCVECGKQYPAQVKNRIKSIGYCRDCSYQASAIARRKEEKKFLEELKNIHPRIKVLSPYIDSYEPVICECLDCGYGKKKDWTPRPCDLLNDRNKGGNGCPKCGGRMKSNLMEFKEKLKAKHPNIKVIGKEYKNNKTRIKCICTVCGHGIDKEWKPKPNSLLRSNSKGCPICSRRLAGQKHGRPIRCLETGVVYNSAAEASRETGIPRTSIAGCVNGEKTHAGGFHWEFVKQ